MRGGLEDVVKCVSMLSAAPFSTMSFVLVQFIYISGSFQDQRRIIA